MSRDCPTLPPLERRTRACRRVAALAGCGWGLLSCARFGFDLLPPVEQAGAGGQDASSGTGGASGEAKGDSGLPGVGGTAGRDASVEGPLDGSVPVDGSVPLDVSVTDTGTPQGAPTLCVYSTPVVLGDPNFPGNDTWSPTLSNDGLTMYLGVVVPGISEQIVVSVRPDRGLTFGQGNVLPPPMTSPDFNESEGTPHLIEGGLALYFYSDRAGGAGDRDLYVSRRADTGVEFETVSAIAELNSGVAEHLPWVSPSELLIYFVTNRDTGDLDIWRASRGLTSRPFNAPAPAVELNSDSAEGGVTFSADRRVVIFASERGGGWDLYRASRATLGIPFSTPTVLAGFNSAATEMDPALSPDGQELFFTSDANGENQIWRSQRTCP